MDRQTEFLQRVGNQNPGPEGSLFSDIRKQGLEALAKLSVPSTKEEYWKYTRLTKLISKAYEREGEKSKVNIPGPFAKQNITIDDKIWSGKLIDEEKLKVLPIEAAGAIDQAPGFIGSLAKPEKHFFDALNSSGFNKGFVLWVAKNFDAGTLDLAEVFPLSKHPYQQRYAVILEEGAKLRLIHRSHSVSDNQMINALLEVKLEKHAALDLYMLQDLTESSSLINTSYIKQAEHSDFRMMTLSLDGELIRNNVNVYVGGEYAQTRLNGLSLGRGNEHVDHHTLIDHLVPNCESHENYKGIFYDKSSGVFNGKVFVRPDAQKTNAFQNNQNIVMTDDAKVYSKPELEIYADDVKCSHGSTTGQFDDEALFYLQSRGISRAKAKTMLVHAFLAELSEQVLNEDLRAYIEERIDAKLLKDS